MTSFIKTFLASFGLFLLFDFIWLGYVMKAFNTAQLSSIARMTSDSQIDVHKGAAVFVYLVMALSFTLFIPAKIESTGLLMTFAWGALLGFSVYAIYDGTNFAILKDYPLAFACADVAWGAFLYGAVAVILAQVKNYLN